MIYADFTSNFSQKILGKIIQKEPYSKFKFGNAGLFASPSFGGCAGINLLLLFYIEMIYHMKHFH